MNYINFIINLKPNNMKRFFTSSGTLWSCLFAMAMMVTAQSARAEYVKLTALSGTGGTGGEGYASLVDAKVATKMGHSFDPTNPERDKAWIVVKAEKAVVPERYFLVTGSDTGSYPERNWKHGNTGRSTVLTSRMSPLLSVAMWMIPKPAAGR